MLAGRPVACQAIRHLWRADIALIFLLEGDAYRLAIASGPLTEEDRAYLDLVHALQAGRQVPTGPARQPLTAPRPGASDHGVGVSLTVVSVVWMSATWVVP